MFVFLGVYFQYRYVSLSCPAIKCLLKFVLLYVIIPIFHTNALILDLLQWFYEKYPLLLVQDFRLECVNR